jgi:hypothetical protein
MVLVPLLAGPAVIFDGLVYGADRLHPHSHTRWSVMVTGPATRITARLDMARDQQLLVPWIDVEWTDSSASPPNPSPAAAPNDDEPSTDIH